MQHRERGKLRQLFVYDFLKANIWNEHRLTKMATVSVKKQEYSKKCKICDILREPKRDNRTKGKMIFYGHESVLHCKYEAVL